MALDFAATYKVLVLGDSNVGKTCIVHRYCDERYYDTYISTIGIDFKQKIINLDGTPIKLQIWDTAGQERFRTLTTAYYRGAMGILLMYDVTSMESFNHLAYWLRNIQENASPDVVKVLAANKCDATTHRAVDAVRGHKIADNFDMPFFEVSCKENINIEEAFLTLARRIREQRGRRSAHQVLVGSDLALERFCVYAAGQWFPPLDSNVHAHFANYDGSGTGRQVPVGDVSIKEKKKKTSSGFRVFSMYRLLGTASLFEASEREGADAVITAQSPSQQGDAWRCTC